MEKKKNNLITRRQAIVSLATITAGSLIKPASIFGVEAVKNKERFAVIGDWGTGESDQWGLGKQMYEAHQRTPFDFVLTAGDNIYSNGSGRYFVKKFEEPFAGLIKDRVNFYAALGNHDVEEGRDDQRNYSLFNMGGANYYTVSKGNGLIDIFMLDSTRFDKTQAGWFENALRNSHAKWKVAVFHHPLYSSGKKHGSNEALRKQIEPLLTHYRVQVVFTGHDHFYERIKPQEKIQHFVTGAGGKMRRGGIDLKSEIRATSYDEDNSFMIIEVDDTEITFKALSETGLLIDSGIIKQE